MTSETMRAAVIAEPRGGFELVERAVPEPGASEVRVAVAACGVCGGDDVAYDGSPAVDYPRVPCHEFVGVVDAVGEDVAGWNPGDRVGVAWHGGHCFTCEHCRGGDLVHCSEKSITGIHRDGGYAEYALARAEALVDVPGGLDSANAAPLLCAGLTSFNALRNAEARPGDLVAALGVGGVGHLAVQYAHAAGFETVAVSRGPDKRDAALDLGADHYVDSDRADPGDRLQALGGADLVFSTAPAADAIANVVDGIGTGGDVVNVGAPESPVPVDVGHLNATRGSVSGWTAGTPKDAEETLAFSARRDVTPTTETFELDDVETAYRRLVDGDVRFRAVVTP